MYISVGCNIFPDNKAEEDIVASPVHELIFSYPNSKVGFGFRLKPWKFPQLIFLLWIEGSIVQCGHSRYTKGDKLSPPSNYMLAVNVNSSGT